MRVLVCGGRAYSDVQTVRRTLDGLRPAIVIQGGAFGADALAVCWAVDNDVALASYPADWKRYGRAAGPIRNQQMLDDGKPDLVVAFPGGRGTADMIRRAQAAGVPVKQVSAPGRPEAPSERIDSPPQLAGVAPSAPAVLSGE